MKKWILVLAVIVSSCGSKEEPRKERTHELGKYLYLTDNNVLHSNKKCYGLRFANDEDGHDVQGMHFILTDRFIDNGAISYCTRCFDDDLYEKVQLISLQNRENNKRPWARQDDEDNVPPSRRHKRDSISNVGQP